MKYWITLFLYIITSTFFPGSNPIIIAVVEEPGPHGSQYPAVIRALFVHQNNTWTSLDKEESHKAFSSQKADWSITDAGEIMGTITSVDDIELPYPDCDWCFMRDKIFRILNPDNLPKLGNAGQRYGDWTHIPKNRPLVLINQQTLRKYEEWQEWDPEKALLDKLFLKLKTIIRTPCHCGPPPSWESIPIELTQSDIEFYRSYKTQTGAIIVSAGLATRHTKDCEGPLSPEDQPIWFYVRDEVKLIGMEMELLDSGDYDNDGEEEFIFEHSGYNSDGYTLFENNFSRRIDYYWKYH